MRRINRGPGGVKRIINIRWRVVVRVICVKIKFQDFSRTLGPEVQGQPEGQGQSQRVEIKENNRASMV